jgi:hypothetical protein
MVGPHDVTRSHSARNRGVGPRPSRWTPPRPKLPVLIDSLGRPRPRTGMPAAFRSPLISPDECRSSPWMRESVQPRRPNEKICCWAVWSKALLIAAEDHLSSRASTLRPSQLIAGCELSINCRLWRSYTMPEDVGPNDHVAEPCFRSRCCGRGHGPLLRKSAPRASGHVRNLT